MFTFSILSILETRPSPLTFLQVRHFSVLWCMMRGMLPIAIISVIGRGILFSVVNRIQPVTLIFCEILNLPCTNIVCIRADVTAVLSGRNLEVFKWTGH